MSRIRLITLTLTLALAATGLTPALAERPPVAEPAAVVGSVRLPPAAQLARTTLEFVREPSAATAQKWKSGLRVALLGDEGIVVGSPEGEQREYAVITEAGDLDGDRRPDLVEQRSDGTTVRSGREGRVLFRTTAYLLPVNAGPVRFLAISTDFAFTRDGADIALAFQGLDGTGKARWKHVMSGTIRSTNAGPAYMATLTDLPVLVSPGLLDAQGGPALLLGALSGAVTPATVASQLALSSLSLTTGLVTARPVLVGAGFGIPYAYPLGPLGTVRGCYATVAPTALISTIGLQCAGAAPVWVRPVELTDPYVLAAGDFDRDGRADVLATTFGFEPARSDEPTRGSRIFGANTGAVLASSPVDGLYPLGVNAGGDPEPDFIRVDFTDRGFAVVGSTFSGTPLYRRAVSLQGSGSLSAGVGWDLTGDRVPDGLVRAEPERGQPLTVVVDGRSGRVTAVAGGDGVAVPGLRRSGGDIVVFDVVQGRLRVTVRGADRGQRLLQVIVPGKPGKPAAGAVGTADLDGDGHRDAVVASRIGTTRSTTAFSGKTGRLLWQRNVPIKPGGPAGPVVVS